MDIVKFTKYYNEPNTNYKVISCVLFRLKENYKSSKIYYDGLKNLINALDTVFSDYYFRLYYDSSIITPEHTENIINNEIKKLWLPLLNDLKKRKKVQLIYYECEKFKKGIYHDGLFGTLLRFIPLFDYEENNNIDEVIITDIDMTGAIIINIKKTLLFMRNNKSKFHFRSHSCYTSLPRFDMFDDEEIKMFPYPMLAGQIISQIKFPSYIFENYLKCMSNKETNECSFISKFIESQRDTKYNPMKVNIDNDFVYGIDELFLAKYIAPYIREHKIIYSCTLSLTTEYSIYNWFLRNDKLKDKKYTEILKQFLGKYYDSSKSNVENYDILDKKIYVDYDNEFINNIISVFQSLEKNNKYSDYDFRWRDVKCVTNYPTTKTSYKLFRPKH